MQKNVPHFGVRYIFFCKFFSEAVVIEEILCPGILVHILVLEGVYRTCVQLLEAVVVAVKDIDVDGKRRSDSSRSTSALVTGFMM